MNLEQQLIQNKKEIQRLNNIVAEQNVLIDTLRITLSRAEKVIEDEKDISYVFTKASKWAMSAGLEN